MSIATLKVHDSLTYWGQKKADGFWGACSQTSSDTFLPGSDRG